MIALRSFRGRAWRLPSRLWRLPDDRRRRRDLRDAIRELERTAPQLPEPETIQRLIAGWGSDWAAEPGYAIAVASAAAAAEGPILECGSGLTTIIAAVYSRHDVWSLEHHPRWYRRVKAALRRNRLKRVHVSLAPLIHYPDFDWYATERLPLPPSFPLVICDGPPGRTRGGRTGLLPVMSSRLPSAVILLDDADRPGEAAVLDDWHHRYGVTVERPDGGRFAIVRVGETR